MRYLAKSFARRHVRAFTIIEAIVTLVIVLILAAMLIPQFSGESASAADIQAHASAQAALSAAATIYQTTGVLPNSSALSAQYPDVSFVNATTSSVSPTTVSVGVNTSASMFAAAVPGGNSTCWMTSWNTNDTSSSLPPTLYAMESTTVSGFSCSAQYALTLDQCPQTPGGTGVSWSTPLICDFSNVATTTTGPTTTTTAGPSTTLLENITAPQVSVTSNTYNSSGDSVAWSWTASTGGSGTIYYYWSLSPSAGSACSSGVTTSTAFSCATALTPGSSYTFSVYAQDANGYSSPVGSTTTTAASAPTSSTTSGSTTTTQAPALSSPTLSLASNSYGASGDSMSWSWTASTGGTGTITYHWQNSPWTSTCSLGSTTSLAAACNGGLTPGAVYTFSLYAQDANGNDSSVVSITVVAAPAPATTTTGTGTTTTAVSLTTPTPTVTLDTTTPSGAGTMSWSWPASTGSTGTIGYYWALSPQTSTCSVGSTTTTSFSCQNSMIPGTAYTLSVYAQDSMGNTSGVGTVTATQVAPATVPDAPTGVRATSASNSSSSVSWSAPAFNGGYSITSYTVTYSSDNGATWTTATTNAGASPITVAGLINGTPYIFEVAATNSVGTGPFSSPSAPATPSTVPGAPTGVSAVGGINAQTTVSWAAPVNNGGAIVTGYTVTGSPSGSCSTSGATSCVVTGLTDGTSYTFTVTATNASGTGPTSSPSSPITPTTTVPGAPTAANASARYQSAVVTWVAPSNNGGSPISLYTVTSSPGAFTCTATSTLSCTVQGLTDGTSYTFTVTATNSIGTGAPSAPSNSITPTTTIPDAPTGLTATPGNASASLSYAAPVYYGGASVTAYVAQYSSDGGTTWTLANTSPSSCSTTTCTVVGLINGTSYEFEVAAVNAVGQGPWSVPSPTVTPITTPGAPTNLTSTLASQSTQLNWSPPASNGGATITLYTVTGSPSGSCTTSTTSCVITGLTNGTSYTFTVTATNAAGTGPSSTSTSVTPAAVPSPPQDVTATPGNTQATVSWSAPATDNGATITGYTVTSTPGGFTCSTSSIAPATPATSCVVTGLTNGTRYTFTVTATNAAGTSAPSLTFDELAYSLSPSGWWPLNDSPGSTTVTDASGNANPGALSGSVTLGGPSPIPGSPGDTSATFAGGDAATTNKPTGAFTFSVLVKTTSTSPVIDIADTGADGASGGWYLLLNGNAAHQIQAAVGAYTNQINTSITNIEDGQWHNVVVTYDGASLSIYLDGSLVASAPESATVASPYGLTLAREAAAAQHYFPGSLSEALLLPTAATPAQVSQIYTASGITPATTPGIPSGVTATSNANTQSVVSWAAPTSDGGSSVIAYVVRYSSDNGTTWTTATTNATATTFTVTGLANGTSYVFDVAARNSAGQGAYSPNSSPATPATSPSAPGAPTAAGAQNSSSALSWTAPASNGGAPISSYAVRYSTDAGTTWVAASTSPSPCTTTSCSVVSIANGTSYIFEVSATNSAGSSGWSGPSNSITPSTVPGAPTGATASLGDTVSQVTWTAPVSNGGAAITLYTVTSSPGGFTCTSTSASNCTVSGLTDGASYTFTVTATNISGTGPASAPSNAVVPAPVPSAPLSPTATPANASASVSWAAPTNNGGSTISAYTVTSSPGGFTCTTTGALTCIVTGLTNGTSYTFTVTATNASGTGPASVATSPVTPFTTPGTPTSVVAQSYTNAQSLVTWNAPTTNGGSPITDYSVEYSAAPYTSWSVATTSVTLTHYTVTGLTNGTSYEFQVAASNAAGPGAWSTPSAPTIPATTANAPTGVTPTSNVSTSVPLSWTAPTSTGGTPVTSYTIEYSPSPYTTWAIATTSPSSCTTTSCTVTGLTNGTSYEFQVAAINNAGTGPYSAASSPAVPSTTPGAPTGLTCSSAASTQSVLTWTAPASNGGATITGYEVQYSSDGGSTWSTATSSATSPYTLTGLTNGTTYECQVAAINPSGTGAFSAPASFVPSTTPSAPTAVTATAGNTQVTVYWGTPTSNGGAAISGYTVSTAPGGSTCSTKGAASCVISGLSNGTSYTFTVTATNASGVGPGATVTATPATTPGAPTGVTATSGNAQATLSWTAPASNGGSAVTSYTVTYSNSPYSTWYSATTSPGTCTTTSCTVTGLTNGYTYEFEVTAVNVMGAGPASSPSNAVLVAGPPSAPTGVTASPGNSQATVNWTGSSSTGGTGLTITGYTVSGYNATTSSAQGSCTTGGATSCIVSGLTNGDSYTFTVTATNSAALTSASSASSPAVVPSTTPGAPTSLSTALGNGSVTVYFSPPASNGGSAITGYTVTSTSGGSCSTTGPSGSSCTIGGLSGGTSYTFTVTASNIDGAGPGATISATAIAVPGAPTSLSATGPDNTDQATVSWAAPASNGGASITSYLVQYSYTNAAPWTTYNTSSTSTSYTLNLSNNNNFYVQVAAVNAAGTGPWSASDYVQWVQTSSYQSPVYGYTCNAGDTNNGNGTCTSTVTGTSSTNTTYSCPGGWTGPAIDKSSEGCWRAGSTYSTLSTCQAAGNNNEANGTWYDYYCGVLSPSYTIQGWIYATATTTTTYTCPSGYTLVGSGPNCSKTYNATYGVVGYTTAYNYGFRG